MPMHHYQKISADLERDGVTIVEGALDDRQIAEAADAVAELMERPQERFPWIRQRTYEVYEEFPIFVELIGDELVLAIARDRCGEDVHLIAAQCSRDVKDAPHAPDALKIHQDMVFFPSTDTVCNDREHHQSGFSATWYLQDTPLEMGPSEFIPQSHMGDLTYDDESLPEFLMVRQPVSAGSLLLFSHHVWRRGRPNQTDTPRDIITDTYACPEVNKVQLLGADGEEEYVVPQKLLDLCSTSVKQLLSPPRRS